MRTADGRLSVGGPNGNVMIYTSEGDLSATKQTIMMETDLQDGQLIYATREFEFDRVLDLTDDGHLGYLGLRKEQLTIKNSYLLPQIVGDISIYNGIEAIRVRSTKTDVIKNIVILPGGLK